RDIESTLYDADDFCPDSERTIVKSTEIIKVDGKEFTSFRFEAKNLSIEMKEGSATEDVQTLEEGS
ncbi:MAG: hypothetical protein AAF202_07825, partial [Pseudomonadota bacterium]